jgi:hypothetical protein
MRFCCYLLCAVFVLMLAACGGSATSAADRSAEARVIAKDFVLERIPNPASASFHFGATSQKVADETYRVAGKVTVANNFGAKLVKTFAATVVYDPATKKWTAKSVSVDD